MTPQPLLEGKVEHDDRDLIISGLRARVRELEEQLHEERGKGAAVSSGVANLRKQLSPLYNALRAVFGEIDAMGIGEIQPHQNGAPRASAAWESWKQKLGGKPAEAIDALLLHGEMNAQQLRIHLRCGRDYVYNVVHTLHKASLINKNGGKISLKEL